MTSMWAWRTAADGAIEVDRNGQSSTCVEFRGMPLTPAGTYERLMLPDMPIYRQAMDKVLAWRALAEKHGARTGIQPAWILAFMYAEGGGNPNAQLQEPSGQIGVGLMALTATPAGFPSKFGITFQEAFDPDKNVGAGADLMVKFGANKLDLPQIASNYNAGPGVGGLPKTSIKSLWGMVEFCGRVGDPISCCHIERVVRSNNTLIAMLGGTPPGPKASTFPTPTEIAAILLGIGVGWFAGRAIGARVDARARG